MRLHDCRCQLPVEFSLQGNPRKCGREAQMFYQRLSNTVIRFVAAIKLQVRGGRGNFQTTFACLCVTVQ